MGRGNFYFSLEGWLRGDYNEELWNDIVLVMFGAQYFCFDIRVLLLVALDRVRVD